MNHHVLFSLLNDEKVFLNFAGVVIGTLRVNLYHLHQCTPCYVNHRMKYLVLKMPFLARVV